MRKNRWYLKKINSDNFNLSMVSLDSAYAIEQLIENKNQQKYKEDLERGILLLNLLKETAINQISNPNKDDNLLDITVSELAKSVGPIRISELIEKLSQAVNEINSENYSHDDIVFFLKIYDAVNKSSSVLVLTSLIFSQH